MSCFFKIALACSLITCHFFCNSFADRELLDMMTQYDLELLQTQEQNVSSVINKTITNSGKKTLDDFLLHPSDNIDVLTARQSWINFLLERQELMLDLEQQLTIAASNESSLQETDDELGKQSLERVYFSFPQLQRFNTSAYALDIAYVMNIAGTCAPLFEHIIMHLGIERLAHGMKTKKSDHGHKHKHKHHHGCNHSHGSSDDGLTYYGLQAFHWGLHLPGLYDMACDIKHRAVMIKYIQNRMIKVANYVRSAEHMHRLLQENQADQCGFEPFEQLQTFFGATQACSDSFKQLLGLLNKATFTGEASLLNHVGNVLAAFALFNKVEQEFACITKAISEIDVYLNMAKLLAGQKSQEPWCFATFSNDELPWLELRKVRHLFVSESKALDFSSANGAHTVVMGDNGSGKSTYLFSIGHALILAQSFGIVPAESCQLTPFSHIYTFRFIQDNMFEGASRFYAECARTQKIIDTIQRDSRRAFVIFDEPFTYTTVTKGSMYLQKMLSELSILSNTISLVATHYLDVGATETSPWSKAYLGMLE